jgi:hypothetical protein
VNYNLILALTSAKDLITVITSIVGSIFGLLGFILGLSGYRRSNRVERDALHAPYFKKKWPEIHKEIKSQIEKINTAISMVEDDLQKPLSEWVGISGSQFRELTIAFDTGKYHWDYLPGLKKEIGKYIARSQRLQKAINNYAFFAWVSTPSFTIWARVIRMQQSESGEAFYEKSEEEKHRQTYVIENSLSIRKKYLGKNYLTKELSSSKFYLLRQKIIKRIILFKIKNLKKIALQLLNILDFNNHRLS